MFTRLEVIYLGNAINRQMRHLFSFRCRSPVFGAKAYSTAMTSDHENYIVPVHRIALEHPNRVAIRDTNGHHTYGDVLKKAISLAQIIKHTIGPEKTQERIGVLCPNDVTYVVSQWACWASGHIGNTIYLICGDLFTKLLLS